MTRASASRDDYVSANREAWNASARYHRGNAQWRKLVAGFATPGYSCLDEVETAALRAIGVEGKDVAQICCNNGRELLSIGNMGAARCVGFDQSTEFLAQAYDLAAIAGRPCAFVEGDIYKTPPKYDSSFDLVVVTIGVFGWMPDLKSFFAVAARLLRPGGTLFIHEEHPVMNMFEPRTATPMVPCASYFREEPETGDMAIVYDGTPAGKTPGHYWFFHTLGDIFNACMGNRLTLAAFQEYSTNINTVEYEIYTSGTVRYPMSYTLVATKGA